jgi:hypothetical protein
MVLKQLPIGDLSFAEIIDNGLLYADKTSYIYELLKSFEKNYFLSRPRRFGKTLLLDTIEELLSGDRKRFKGLWIDQSDYTFPFHPVLSLSLSLESKTSEILETNLLTTLGKIAQKENLLVDGKSPDVYLDGLIQALYGKYNSTVAVLIDEYDAPVTRNMSNTDIAQANAKILHNFFATLKKTSVRSCIRLTMVTGITRYALTSMDSGPNHLIDISLDPRFEGLCGFTIDDFDTLFTDRLEETLAALKAEGIMGHSASHEDLRAEILSWYDGYNWGGKNRVLNPYSILHFFKNNLFDNYWVQSGRPGHLTALIQERPYDFLEPTLKTYLSAELRKSYLNNLAAVPVLFHSGYLTVDKRSLLSKTISSTGKIKKIYSYSFRIPNLEIDSSYYDDCFSIIFSAVSDEELKTKGEELRKAFLARDERTVSMIFRDLFSAVSYYQRPKDEKTFHAFVHLILRTMGFRVLS